MSTFRRYTFDLDFDPPARKAPEPPPSSGDEDEDEPEEQAPPAPTFTEEELMLARETSFEEGRRAAQAEAAQSHERKVADALAALPGVLATLRTGLEELADGNARTAVRVAMAVVRRVLPAACETHAFEEVTRVVEECVGHILDEPRIIVRVSPKLLDSLREPLEAAAQGHGFEGRVVVQADPRLKPGDCRVEWTDGGAERDQARLLRDIDETVERALAPPERPQ